MVVFIPLTTSPPSKSVQVCPGTQGGSHAANWWDIIIEPLRSVTLLRRTVIHRGAGGPIHIPDITHPTLYSTNAPFTMLSMGCPHPSLHNSYPVATHDIPNPPIVTEEGFAAAGYRQYDRIIPEDLWARLAELATVELNPSMLEEVHLQAPGEGGGRYQTTVSSIPHWLPDDLWQAVLALLGFSLQPLEGLEALCPEIIERWEAEPWKGFQIPHRDFALSVKQSLQCMVVFIPLTTSPPSKSLQVCPGTQGGYHAANWWEIVIQPLRSVTLLRGTVIHRGAGGPGRALFIPFAPACSMRGYRSRMLTVEPESVPEHWCRCVHCSMLVQCDLAYLHLPIHYANFQLEVDPRPVPVPEQLEGKPQEQQQSAQHQGPVGRGCGRGGGLGSSGGPGTGRLQGRLAQPR